MLLISKRDVPVYLHSSDFYSSLSDDCDDLFELPEEHFRNNSPIVSSDDLRTLLSTLSFWGVYKIPDFLVMELFSENKHDKTAILAEFGPQLPYLEALFKIKEAETNIFAFLTAVELGDTLVLKILFESSLYCESEVCSVKECPALCKAAALHGSIPCLRYLREEQDCCWDASVCEAAAGKGHMQVLQYLHNGGCPWDKPTCSAAARGGHLDCLRYAHQHGCSWGYFTCSQALLNGHYDCLVYAHSNACMFNPLLACVDAVFGGNLDCLRFAHEHGGELSSGVMVAAARLGRLACLQYAHEHGCQWYYYCTGYAAEHGHLDCLQYMHEHGCPWEHNTCHFAAAGGHLACLQYAHSHGCPWDERTTQAAAVWRHYDCLQYAVDRNCPCDGPHRALYDLHCTGAPRMVDTAGI